MIIILTVFVIIALPLDYIKYKTSRVYRKERRKYSFFATSTCNFMVHNAALKEHIPLGFVENPTERSYAAGWLVLGRTLVVCDVFSFEYDESSGHWGYLGENEKEEQITMSLGEYIEMRIDEANYGAGRKICDRAVVLIEETDASSSLSSEPSFIVFDGNIAEALHELCRRVQ